MPHRPTTEAEDAMPIGNQQVSSLRERLERERFRSSSRCTPC
ncbi:hypothetical protein [Streptomyces luteogriseus]